MSAPRLDEIANSGAELLTRLANELPARLRVMRDAHAGLPAAASYEQERTSGHTTRKFCERCEQDPKDCACGKDAVITTYPAVSDPVGEAASTPDRARDDRRALERHLTAAYKAIDAAAKIADRYQPRTASDRERTETAKANELKPGCIICAQTEVSPGIKRFDYITSDQRCRWHLDFRRDAGRDATPQETEQHARGITVKRPA